MTDWDGMSEDEIRRRLDEAFARIRAVGEAQEHVWLEQKFAESPDVFAWPPAPNTAHPSFERQSSFVRGLIAEGKHTVLLAPPPRRARFYAVDDEVDFDMPDPIRLEVRRCWALAPWSGRPYVYMWRVGVESKSNRWVAGDSWAEHPPAGQEWRAR